MRWWVFAFALVGCEGTGGVYVPPGDVLTCANPAHEPTDGGMTFLALRSGAVDFFPIFVSDTQYEDYGASLCRDPVTGTVRWIFESNGDPLGSVEMLATTVGNADLQSSAQTFTIEIFANTTTYGSVISQAATVTNQDFVSGAWVIDSLTPTLEATVQGETLAGAEYVLANFAVSATTL